MFIQYITVALPHVAYLFVLGMLFYFYLRQVYIKAILQITSIAHPTRDFIRVRRKVRILAIFQIALLTIWLWLLLPDWISKVITVNMEYVWLKSLYTAIGFIFVLIAGGEAAKWLTHDEDFNEQLTKNNKP